MRPAYQLRKPDNRFSELPAPLADQINMRVLWQVTHLFIIFTHLSNTLPVQHLQFVLRSSVIEVHVVGKSDFVC